MRSMDAVVVVGKSRKTSGTRISQAQAEGGRKGRWESRAFYLHSHKLWQPHARPEAAALGLTRLSASFPFP